MMMTKFVFLLSLQFIFLFNLSAQTDWELKKDKNGIKVYYKDSKDSYIKELKMTTTLDASLSTIMALLYDVETYPDWVYSCTEANLEKQVSDAEIYYYSRMDFPWPLWDRDFIAHGFIQQDTLTGVITTHSIAVPDYKAAVEGVVRMTEMEISWTLTPLAYQKTKVEYYLKSDPGGSIPAWAINLALDKGPVQSLTRLKNRLQEKTYQVAELNFIQDFKRSK